MNILKLAGVFFLISCGNNSIEHVTSFRRLIPDTSKTWSGRMTGKDFSLTRIVEKKLHLGTLSGGVKKPEFRVWRLHGLYDPQSLLILNESDTKYWNLRILSFYQSVTDSVSSDYTKKVRKTLVDSLNLDQCWSLASQSDLKKGDSYGCVDGENVIIEIADFKRYKFMWYRCPDMHANKDSVFLFVTQLTNKFKELISVN